jgi:hypothetical protein
VNRIDTVPILPRFANCGETETQKENKMKIEIIIDCGDFCERD